MTNTYGGDPEPFTPRPPAATELGRLVTHGTLAPAWACRWCRQPLTTSGTGLACPTCDTTEDRK